jgi:hypothetical protein
MKLKAINNWILFIMLMAALFASCTKDLDRQPLTGTTAAEVYNTPDNYKQVLAKIYAGLAVSGQQGPAGNPDITGYDEGFSNYLRQYWQMEELTTDEAVIGWGDADIQDLHNMNWTTSNTFVRMIYNRIYYQISLCNEFIRESNDDALNSKGFSGDDITRIKQYRAEARFMRALSYWHALDLFGNIPFVTEKDPVGNFLPPQISKDSAFRYVESELLDIESALADPRQNEYARADKAADWMLLAKLYLNAEVYTGQGRYSECLNYCNKIIAAGYTLETEYRNLFLADNNTSGEIILPVAFDALRTQTYGGMVYLIHAEIGGSMNAADFGVSSGGWAGLRTTKNLVNVFPDVTGSTDQRAMFYTDGQSLDIKVILNNFTDGYAITKYKNINRAGLPESDPTNTFVNTDYPMFRLGDVYLMYAEAALRGGSGGDLGLATEYINKLRERAYGNTSGNISQSDLTLDFILNERERELYWEGTRRTDLIRFGKFTSGSYLWPFKGGVLNGTGVEDYRSVFPIPVSDITVNPNLVQNPGY